MAKGFVSEYDACGATAPCEPLRRPRVFPPTLALPFERFLRNPRSCLPSWANTDPEPPVIDDAELTRRSMMGFGEMCAVTGLWGVGPEVVIRWPNALGAKIDSAGNPWISAAVVPLGASPPEDDPRLPMAVWTLGESIPGRAEAHGIATPCLGLSLDAPAMEFDAGEAVVGVPSMTTVAEVNERAYNQIGAFAPLVIGIQDGRIRTHGILVGGEFACVAITLRLHDDVGIFYVATEAEHRRQGLASP